MDLTTVAEQVADLTIDDPAAANRLARWVGRVDVISAVLTGLLDDEPTLEAVALRSFHHSNHFDKIVLLDDPSGSDHRLAIHLWRPPYSATEVRDEQIHDHRCDFWSTVLFGSLTSEEFSRDPSGESYAEAVYSPSWTDAGAKHNGFRYVGISRLRAVGPVSHQAGVTYYMPRMTIHRISISPEPVATVLLRGPNRVARSSVFRTGAPYGDADLPVLSADQVREDINFILGSIT